MKNIDEIIGMLHKDIQKFQKQLNKQNRTSPSYKPTCDLIKKRIRVTEEALLEWENYKQFLLAHLEN